MWLLRKNLEFISRRIVGFVDKKSQIQTFNKYFEELKSYAAFKDGRYRHDEEVWTSEWEIIVRVGVKSSRVQFRVRGEEWNKTWSRSMAADKWLSLLPSSFSTIKHCVYRSCSSFIILPLSPSISPIHTENDDIEDAVEASKQEGATRNPLTRQ